MPGTGGKVGGAEGKVGGAARKVAGWAWKPKVPSLPTVKVLGSLQQASRQEESNMDIMN